MFKLEYIDGELVATETESKTLDDIKQVIELNRTAAIVDKFIELHLLELDPEQQAADEWYKHHLDVERLDPEEVCNVAVDQNGNETKLPNRYYEALTKRTELETQNPWLKGLRGVPDAPPRTPFTMTVDDFKAANEPLFSTYNKNQGADIGGTVISLNEANQNGLAAVLTGLQLAEKLGQNVFPINFKAETPTGDTLIPFATMADYEAFALQFLVARQQFFQ